MKYVMAFGVSREPLAPGTTRASVAAECREAALAFMAGVAAGWDKVDLARWLVGPYATATRHHPRGERTLVAGSAPGASRAAPPAAVEAVLTTARGRVLAGLEKAALEGGSLDFAPDAVARGFVRRVLDDDGESAWIPVDGARVRLVDRVRALFVADSLDDPDAYADLYVCHRCEAVVFDAGARQLGMCSAHRRMSGIVARDDDARAVGES